MIVAHAGWEGKGGLEMVVGVDRKEGEPGKAAAGPATRAEGGRPRGAVALDPCFRLCHHFV